MKKELTTEDLKERLRKNPQLLEQPGFCAEWLARAYGLYGGDFFKMGLDLATVFRIVRVEKAEEGKGLV